MKSDSIKKVVSDFGKTLASLGKIALFSRPADIPYDKENKEKTLVILGNGPSLKATIENDIEKLVSYPLMAVNFAVNAPDFIKLRPCYYLLADGHFFNGLQRDPNVRKLWDNLSNVSWDMTLFIPKKYSHLVKALLMNAGKNIKTATFNMTPVEGFKWVKHAIFSASLGMPRPRNVMIPAIMTGIAMGYKKILLFGADHTWTKTLDVDDENFVVTVQPHFYEDNEEERQRVRDTYRGIRLHQVLESMSIAFKSYWEIKDYARAKGVEIINGTPGSMIDAFSRGSF